MFDTIGKLEPLFTSVSPARERFAAGDLAAGLAAWRSFETETGIAARVYPGYRVMEAAELDGYQVMSARQMWGLFNPARKIEASAWAFERFRQLELPGQAGAWLQELATPFGELALKVELLVVPADPANRRLMLSSFGLSGFAGVPGKILLQIWPSEGNLERLPAVLARLLALQLWWQRPGRRSRPTLADFLVVEGLAASFVSEKFPDTALPWLVAFAKPRDWDQVIAQVAREFYRAQSYADIEADINGRALPAGELGVPAAKALSLEELEYARGIIKPSLAETDSRRIAAYLYGDELVVPQGHSGVGMVQWGGLEACYRTAQVFTARMGYDIQECLGRPTDEVVFGSDYFF